MGIFDSLGGASSSGQPVAYNPQTSSLTPQQQIDMSRLRALQGAATSPYTGNAAGGGAAQGISQLVAALLARKKAQQMQQNMQPTPAPVTPAPQPSANSAVPSFGLGGGDPGGLMAPG